MKKLTDKQKVDLRNKAKLEIERLEKIFADTETLQLLDSFKNKFNLCESAYKIILEEHQKAKGRNIPIKKLRIIMQQVPFALNFAGYSFDKELLSKLFGGESNIKGNKSIKTLRDSITHSINQNSVEEIKERKEELFKYMDEFLNIIKTFDRKENK